MIIENYMSRYKHPKVYEIIWEFPKYEKGEKYILKVCDFLETSFTWLYRDDVVSINKSKLQKVIEYLNFICSSDEKFYIVEKKYDSY